MELSNYQITHKSFNIMLGPVGYVIIIITAVILQEKEDNKEETFVS